MRVLFDVPSLMKAAGVELLRTLGAAGGRAALYARWGKLTISVGSLKLADRGMWRRRAALVRQSGWGR